MASPQTAVFTILEVDTLAEATKLGTEDPTVSPVC
jgi:hypothetical protein